MTDQRQIDDFSTFIGIKGKVAKAFHTEEPRGDKQPLHNKPKMGQIAVTLRRGVKQTIKISEKAAQTAEKIEVGQYVHLQVRGVSSNKEGNPTMMLVADHIAVYAENPCGHYSAIRKQEQELMSELMGVGTPLAKLQQEEWEEENEKRLALQLALIDDGVDNEKKEEEPEKLGKVVLGTLRGSSDIAKISKEELAEMIKEDPNGMKALAYNIFQIEARL